VIVDEAQFSVGMNHTGDETGGWWFECWLFEAGPTPTSGLAAGVYNKVCNRGAWGG
jgi:hypothetical protein